MKKFVGKFMYFQGLLLLFLLTALLFQELIKETLILLYVNQTAFKFNKYPNLFKSFNNSSFVILRYSNNISSSSHIKIISKALLFGFQTMIITQQICPTTNNYSTKQNTINYVSFMFHNNIYLVLFMNDTILLH